MATFRIFLQVLAVVGAVNLVSATGQLSKPKHQKPLELHIDTKNVHARNKTSPLIHGLFFEDINHSGDGGLYGELIQNRAFQSHGNTSTLAGYRSIGGAKLSLDYLNPVSDALKTVLRVDIPDDATGEVGFLNEGYWGMDVRPQKYDASFLIKAGKSNRKGKRATGVTLSLRSNLTDAIWTKKHVPFKGKLGSSDYSQFETVLHPRIKAPNSNNTFAITFSGKEAAGQTFYFSLISLFPPTFKGRKNGLRKDLADHLKAIDPKFLRFPGGNNLEGESIDTRWKWKENIGPLKDRPGRQGNWGYYNTDGLGYLEYLLWCEDMELEPLLTVYAGYSLGTSELFPNQTVSPEDLDFYIQEAIDQIEYAIGDPKKTKWGALRAKHGHPKPFKIKYVEIGNEDWFSDSYYWRYPRFLEALQKKYPDITYISSQALEENPSGRNISIPRGGMWDLHHYQTPQFYKDNFNYFDNWQEVFGYPDVTIFVGEFSVLSRDQPGGVDWENGVGRFEYPPMIAAVGEAIFALAMERNPHVVHMSSYAPLLQNFNSYRWTPNKIAFSADPDDTVLSTSYYLFKLFGTYRGKETLPIRNLNGDFNPLWWQASINNGRIFVKIVNSDSTPQPVRFLFDGAVKTANATTLREDDPYAFNFRGNGTIVPQPTAGQKIHGKTVEWKVPGWSVNVLEVRLK